MNRKEKYSDYSSGFVDSDLSTDMHDKIMIWLDKNIYKVVSGLSESIDMTRAKVKCVWESPIIKGNAQFRSIVGYIDMLVCIDIPGSEAPDGSIIYNQGYKLAFEVKSKINSIGEVIRQIRQYQSFVSPDKFIIVSTDDKFKSLLASQGIGFVHCPTEEII